MTCSRGSASTIRSPGRTSPRRSGRTSGRGYWAVVRHADVREVSRDTGRFVSGLGTELFDLPVDIARSYSGMLNMDAPEHTTVPGVCQRSLLGTTCRWARGAAFDPSVSAVLDDVSENGACDFAKDVADALPTRGHLRSPRCPARRSGRIAALSRSAVPLGDPEFGGLDASFRAVGELIEYGMELAARQAQCSEGRSAHGARDHGDRRSTARATSDVGTFFELLLTAGIETTGAAIAHGLHSTHGPPRANGRLEIGLRDLGPVGSRGDPPLVDARSSTSEGPPRATPGSRA